jgi:hypothetical protein
MENAMNHHYFLLNIITIKHDGFYPYLEKTTISLVNN